MSPIDENELRDELWFAEPPAATDPDALGAAVISRGRAVHRQRRVLASVAAVVVVALAGFGLSTVLSGPPREAVPAQTPSETPIETPSESPTPSESASVSTSPSVSATPSATPRRTASASPTGSPSGDGPWSDESRVPSNYGAIGSFTLPHGRDGDWEAADLTLPQCDVDSRFPAMADLEAARVRQNFWNEGADAEAVLVFRNEGAARAFLQQVAADARACEQVPLPETAEPGQPRTRYRSGSYSVGDQGLRVGSFDETYADGRWSTLPGATQALWARRGRAVTMASSGGEYVGDVFENRPDVIAELRASLEQALTQMCTWTSAGC